MSISPYKDKGKALNSSSSIWAPADNMSTPFTVQMGKDYSYKTSGEETKLVKSIDSTSYGHWGYRFDDDPVFKYKKNGTPIPAALKINAPEISATPNYAQVNSPQLSSSADVPFRSNHALLSNDLWSTSRYIAFKYINGKIYVRYNDDKVIVPTANNFNWSKSSDGIYIQIQAPGGGGAGCDQSHFDLLCGGPGGGAGAYAAIYINLRYFNKLFAQYGEAYMYISCDNWEGGAGGTGSTSASARNGKGGSSVYLEAYANGERHTLMKIGGGGGAPQNAYDANTNNRGEGGAVEVYDSVHIAGQRPIGSCIYVLGAIKGGNGGYGRTQAQYTTNGSKCGVTRSDNHGERSGIEIPWYLNSSIDVWHIPYSGASTLWRTGRFYQSDGIQTAYFGRGGDKNGKGGGAGASATSFYIENPTVAGRNLEYHGWGYGGYGAGASKGNGGKGGGGIVWIT